MPELEADGTMTPTGTRSSTPAWRHLWSRITTPRSGNRHAPPVLLAILLVAGGCGSQSSLRAPASAAPGGDQLVDVHFHVSNYAYQGVSLKTLIDRYMGDRIIRSVLMPLPLQQKWDWFEHYAQDRLPPTYYLGPKAELYYYAFADAMIAREYAQLPAGDRARLDPMITGFNPMDLYAVHHIKRVLLTFPGVFSGIGEFTIHKELVSNKIAGDPIETITTQGVPPDVAPGGKLSLHSPALAAILDLVAETGMVATLHNDIYESDVRYDGTVRRVSPARTYVDALKQLCARAPAATVIWAHTGLGRFVKPAADHLTHVAAVLDSCPAWSVDISWDLVQEVIVRPGSGMPALAEWGRFITRYQDRVLWGSDTVIYSRNRLDEGGQAVRGARMSVVDYLAVGNIAAPLWGTVGPEVARKVKVSNAVRLFDGARAKVRAWEAAHGKDDLWNLEPPRVTPP